MPIRSGDSIQIVEPNAGIVRGVASVSSAVPLSEDPRFIDLILDRPIDPIYAEPQGTSGDLVFDTSAANPGTIIRDNTFRRHLGVGILNCASNSLIDHNVFEDLNLSAIRLMPAMHGPFLMNKVVSSALAIAVMFSTSCE